MSKVHRALALAAALVSAPLALADNWVAHLTVDNQFDVYYGTPSVTTFHAGGGASWSTTYTFNALGRPATDYLYVATSSDHSGYQGFIGDFQNTTSGAYVTTTTAPGVWEVFAAGADPATNPFYPSPWPSMLMPTQTQVDTAIAHATANGLWTNVSTRAGGAPNGASPWGFHAGIDPSANWIWYDSGTSPHTDVLRGWNHDEFLVFRVPGAVSPAPGSAALLGLAAFTNARRRRAPLA